MATSQTSAKRNSCNNANGWALVHRRKRGQGVRHIRYRALPSGSSPSCSRWSRGTFSFAMGAQKLGQPVPDSNLVSELNNALLQTDAAIQTLVVQIEVFAGKRSFRAFFTSYPELQWS
jgi:hypothetical protein